MLNDIQLFRDFVANANDSMIDNAIRFINVAGYMEGLNRDEALDDNELIKCAIEYSTHGDMLVPTFIKRYNERLKQEKK